MHSRTVIVDLTVIDKYPLLLAGPRRSRVFPSGDGDGSSGDEGKCVRIPHNTVTSVLFRLWKLWQTLYFANSFPNGIGEN